MASSTSITPSHFAFTSRHHFPFNICSSRISFPLKIAYYNLPKRPPLTLKPFSSRQSKGNLFLLLHFFTTLGFHLI
ncbi:Endonuclease or glycosyl hydrolase [Hibiscus syriacus]|uniref:Endonuclease or glycosyl hydrolase n=1 Tax=Hibiscus syriacus TaxID=106335 RepID=A0A6A3ARM2_HIBSY|nr:Endonuclease or glycosyl hydrolase [Hibiscus syriacus]